MSEVLMRRFAYDETEAVDVAAGLLLRVETVEPVTFETQVCRDPDDDAILGTAIAGNAACVVTGDSDLLVLERFQGVDIVSPSEFARYEVGNQS